MNRRVALNVGLLIFSIALSFILLEGALRIYNPVNQTVKGDTVVPPVNYDEVRRYSNDEGLAPEVHIHQNSIGFRGADPPADLADRLSIITVGGSTTRSVGQSDDRTWTALLGDGVADCFNRTWINNAGFEGHTSFAHIDLIRNYINQVHPKVVVMLIGANEVFAGGARIVEYHSLNLDGGLRGFVKNILFRSEVVNLGMTLYRSFLAWNAGLNRGSSWTYMDGPAMPSGGEAKLAVARDLQPAYAERLRLMIRLLREGQVIPVLMTQPTLAGIGQDPTTGKELSRLRGGQFFYQAFEIYNNTMRQVAQTETVKIIDLAQSMPKDTKYYYDYMHYTDVGARKVAQLATIDLLPYLEHEFPSFKKASCQVNSAARTRR